MAKLSIRPWSDDLPYGSRIGGVTWDTVRDEALRQQILDTFEARGLIVFEEVEATNAMQVELSSIFGPMQEYTIKGVPQIEEEGTTGIIDLAAEKGDTTIF